MNRTIPGSGVFAANALRYYQAGWSPIPVWLDKRPAVSGYHGRNGARPDGGRLAEWIRRYPDCGIALRLPPDVVGIDVDAYDGRAGHTSLNDLVADLGPLPECYVSTAREDGISGIRLFAIPPEYEGMAWAGKAGEGVDIITSDERYVIACPTIHPSGKVYQWWRRTFNDTWEGPEDIPSVPIRYELPRSWCDQLVRSDSAEASSSGGRISPRNIRSWLNEYGNGEMCNTLTGTADHWATEIEETRDAGGAHDEVARGVFAIIGDVVNGHTGGNSALWILYEAFRHAAGARRGSQEFEKEWRRLIQNAVEKAKAEPLPDDPCEDPRTEWLRNPPPKGQMPWEIQRDERRIAEGKAPFYPENFMEEENGRDALFRIDVKNELWKRKVRSEAARQERAETEADAPVRISVSDGLAQKIRPVSFLAQGIIPMDGNTMLVAQRKAGKTTVVHNLVRSVSDGVPFLNVFAMKPLPQGKKLVVLDFEMYRNQLWQWLRDQDIGNPELVDVYSFRGAAGSFGIMNAVNRAEWARELIDASAGYVVLDCLAPAMIANGLDESDNTEVGTFLNCWDDLLRRASVPGSFVTHHMGHSNERGRGASRMRDWADSEIHLLIGVQGNDGDSGDLNDGKLRPGAARHIVAEGRDVEVSELSLSFDRDSRQLKVSGGSRKDTQMTELYQTVLQFVKDNPGCTQSEIRRGVSGYSKYIIEVIREDIETESICVHATGKGANSPQKHYVKCPDPSYHTAKHKL